MPSFEIGASGDVIIGRGFDGVSYGLSFHQLYIPHV
jgi:hypothetical protein